MILKALGFAVSLSIASAAVAQHGPEVGDYSGLPRDLADAAVAYDVAQFHVDRAELDRLLAADYVLYGTDGAEQAKAQALAGATDPERKTSYVAISKQVRRAWDNGALLAGIVDARGTDHGKPFTFRGRFSDVWAKRDGKWEVVFTQIEKID